NHPAQSAQRHAKTVPGSAIGASPLAMTSSQKLSSGLSALAHPSPHLDDLQTRPRVFVRLVLRFLAMKVHGSMFQRSHGAWFRDSPQSRSHGHTAPRSHGPALPGSNGPRSQGARRVLLLTLRTSVTVRR